MAVHPSITQPKRAEIDNLPSVDSYRKWIGDETADRILDKAKLLHGMHITNINSTYYGGGVASLLSSLTLLMNQAGLETGWRVLQGTPDYFSVTKKMHNALQGGSINLTRRKKNIYEGVVHENAVRNHLTHDAVIVHDPQPLPMIEHYPKTVPWIWRCHIDLTDPDQELWEYLKPFIEQYDAVIVSREDYKQNLQTPQLVFEPAIDPFSILNKELTEAEIDERLDKYSIPTDKPILLQVSRFDKWKDPEGVIDAFKLASEEIDSTLVLLGNVATDDPEGRKVYESLLDQESSSIKIMSVEDTALVNALQTRAAVVLQKSKREGFGLTVAEAMWKGTPVIGGNVGGIRNQIVHGENGYLVDTIEETANYMIELVKDEGKREKLGKRARETVRERFLLTRYLEDYLDLLLNLEIRVVVKGHNAKQD